MDKRMFEICLDNVYRNNLPLELRHYRRIPDDQEFEKITKVMKCFHKEMQEYEAAVIYAVFGMDYFKDKYPWVHGI